MGTLDRSPRRRGGRRPGAGAGGAALLQTRLRARVDHSPYESDHRRDRRRGGDRDRRLVAGALLPLHSRGSGGGRSSGALRLDLGLLPALRVPLGAGRLAADGDHHCGVRRPLHPTPLAVRRGAGAGRRLRDAAPPLDRYRPPDRTLRVPAPPRSRAPGGGAADALAEPRAARRAGHLPGRAGLDGGRFRHELLPAGARFAGCFRPDLRRGGAAGAGGPATALVDQPGGSAAVAFRFRDLLRHPSRFR
jgi:hypothetical protein